MCGRQGELTFSALLCASLQRDSNSSLRSLQLAEKFEYQDDPAKQHGGKEGAIDVLRKYGDESNRFKGWREEDLDFLSRVVDEDLMNMFEYRLPPQITS